MLNKAPIFINGLNRGGTNLLHFLIAAHPEVCVLGRETHELFYGRSGKPVGKWLNRLLSLPIIISTGQHMFYNRNLEERNHIPGVVGRYIDWVLFRAKMGSVMNRFKDWQGTKYSKQEVKESRLLCKNTNGVIFASKELLKIYPDAIFIAFVRNGLALCESYIRRGRSVREIGLMYERVCQKMIEDEARLNNYFIFRFEDMVNDPVSFVQELYSFIGLDISQVEKFGLKAKKSMDRDGERKFKFGNEYGERVWVPLERLNEHFRKDVNQNQISRLRSREIKEFKQYAEKSMKTLGYL